MAIRNYNIQSAIGLIPAAGTGSRIAPLSGSKELYPIGFRSTTDGNLRPKVVCHYLLESMRLAGIRKAYVLLRDNKWDIPAYLGDGSLVDMNLGYLVVTALFGVPYTIERAYEFVQDAVVTLGFPDIIFQPQDAFVRLLAHLSDSEADLVLGVVPFDQPSKGGMVDFDTNGCVSFVVDKPQQSTLRYSWFTAAWTPSFTEFLHQYLVSQPFVPTKEVLINDVIQAAIDSGLKVEVEVFENGNFLDIGTPEDLVRAVRNGVMVADKITTLDANS